MLIVMNISTGACGNETALLAEAQGEFGSNYGIDENCRWRIQVDEDQVNIFVFYCLSSLLRTRHCCPFLFAICCKCNAVVEDRSD